MFQQLDICYIYSSFLIFVVVILGITTLKVDRVVGNV